MILVVSGEGPTDIGTCTNAHGKCSGDDFRPGPMSIIIDKLIEPIAKYSLLDSGAFEFVSKASVSALSKELPHMLISAGKKRDYETAFFFKNALALARYAKQRANEDKCAVGVVLFCDADGTRSTERGCMNPSGIQSKEDSCLKTMKMAFQWFQSQRVKLGCCVL